MTSLTNLPQEILSIIVSMAHGQDKRLKARLERSRDRIVKPTQEVMKLSEWYGISLLALHGTCKNLERLAKPYVFESVKLSKSTEEVFSEIIIPKYASFIKTAVFDTYPSKHKLIFEDFLDMLREMPALRCLTFDTTETISALEKLYLQAQVEVTPSTTAAKRRNITATRRLFASLSERITHLVCLEATRKQMKFLLERFVNLQYLKRRLHEAETGPDDSGECEALSALKHLKELDLSSLTHETELNFKKLKARPKQFSWRGQWDSFVCPSITTLRLTCDILELDHWRIVSNLAISLESLTLDGIRIRNALRELEEGEIHFAQLMKLDLTGDRALVRKVLQLLKLSPITFSSVRLVSVDCDTMSNMFYQDQATFSELLRPFETSLKVLKITSCTVPYSRKSLEKLKAKCKVQKPMINLDCFTPEETYLFGQVHELTYSLDMEDHRARQSRSVNEKGMFDQIEQVLEYAKQRATSAFQNHETEELNRVAALLRPMAAKQMMDKE